MIYRVHPAELRMGHMIDVAKNMWVEMTSVLFSTVATGHVPAEGDTHLGLQVKMRRGRNSLSDRRGVGASDKPSVQHTMESGGCSHHMT